MRRFSTLLVAACLLLTSLTLLTLDPAGRAAETTASELAQALQKKYSTIRDFSADFVQEYQGGVLRKRLVERGKLFVKKPGKWRWDYKSPEEKQFVSDGLKVYQIYPADKQAFVGSLPPAEQATTPVLFLAGKGDLTRDFTAALVPPPANTPTGARALKLVPRTPQPDYDWLSLIVDGTSLTLRGLVTVDAQGGTSSFTFTNLKENIGISNDLFPKIPRGFDVVTDSGRR